MLIFIFEHWQTKFVIHPHHPKGKSDLRIKLRFKLVSFGIAFRQQLFSEHFPNEVISKSSNIVSIDDARLFPPQNGLLSKIGMLYINMHSDQQWADERVLLSQNGTQIEQPSPSKFQT